MQQLMVSIEKKGTQIPVGRIIGESSRDACFSYSQEYLDVSDSRAISVSLPLQEEPFSQKQTRYFFEGLLPEGFLRSSIARANHADDADYLRLLEMLGSECLGAIRISTEEFPEVDTCYRELTESELQDLAREGAEKSAELVVRSRLSLTGASGKTGVYQSESGKWYMPLGLAPSTHILKQSHVRYRHIVQNEQLCQLTANLLGIETPFSKVVSSENPDGQENVLFSTKRYDRTFEGSSRYVSGLLCPLRLHQEDFAQALGIASADKYEPPEENYLRQMFNLLRERSASPIEDQMKLWDMIVFHYLIGNTDGHIKNYSLLYDADLRAIRLAPAYDIVSTIIYRNHTSNMAFQIGGVRDWYQIDRSCFKQAAQNLQLNSTIFMKRYDSLYNQFEKALLSAADQLEEEGCIGMHSLADQILSVRR